MNKRNEVLVIWDSVGWEVFEDANTPNLDALSIFKPCKAFSFGTWTIPGVFSMLYGGVPMPESINMRFYDRPTYPFHPHAYRPGARVGFKHHKYNTYAISSNAFMWKEYGMGLEFDEYYECEGKNRGGVDMGPSMVEYCVKNCRAPFFAVLLFTETHVTYMERDSLRSTQVEAVEYLDKLMKPLYDGLPENTRIIVTADHGDLFNEKGGWVGHDPRNHDIIKSGRLGELLEVFLCVMEK